MVSGSRFDRLKNLLEPLWVGGWFYDAIIIPVLVLELWDETSESVSELEKFKTNITQGL